MTFPTLKEMSRALENKKASSLELTKDLLKKSVNANKSLNCFISFCEENALLQAAKADKKRALGSSHPLLGLPIAHKDIFCIKDTKTSCGSKMLDNFYAPYTATAVEKLTQAGMVTIGKTNLDEFAMGSSNETSFYGPCKNPWNLERSPGGSSGGSASAVAANLIPCATGTDTGGSIRQPASFCGVTGLKPTYGRVSRWGMIAYASSLDQGGLFAKNSEDIALVLESIAGFDEKDSTSINIPVPRYSELLDQDLNGKVIGLPKDFFTSELHPNVEQCILNVKNAFEKMGARVIDIELPNMKLAIPCYYIIAPAECSSNLSRFDGIRFGHRSNVDGDLKTLYKHSRGEGFGLEVKRRVLTGSYVLSSGYYDAYYIKAQKIRRLILKDFIKAFETVDLILGPTTPTPAFLLNQKQTPQERYLADVYTTAVNLAGLPGLSMPAGFIDSLPIGAQLIAPAFKEERLLNAAFKYQQETDFHLKSPNTLPTGAKK